MDFTYSYKTPDGARHEGEVRARSRDAAYKALNAQGIRPMRVEAKPMTPERRRRLFAACALGVVAAAAAFAAGMHLWREASARMRYKAETRAAYESLERAAAAARAAHAKAFGAVDFALFRDYALIERSADLSPFAGEIERAKAVVEGSRERVRGLFRGIYETFPPESANERLDAQRLYGEIMDEIDASEEKLEADECALELLDANRGKWGLRGGRLYFIDPFVEREFRFFRKDVDGSAARWKRDFGRRAN